MGEPAGQAAGGRGPLPRSVLPPHLATITHKKTKSRPPCEGEQRARSAALSMIVAWFMPLLQTADSRAPTQVTWTPPEMSLSSVAPPSPRLARKLSSSGFHAGGHTLSPSQPQDKTLVSPSLLPPPLPRSITATSSSNFDLHRRPWRLRTCLWLGFSSEDPVVISKDLPANPGIWLYKIL
jgi:hypothetical protein